MPTKTRNVFIVGLVSFVVICAGFWLKVPGVEQKNVPVETSSKSKPLDPNRFLGEGIVPNVVGLRASKAFKLAEKSGYYASFKTFDVDDDSPYYNSKDFKNLSGLFACTQTLPAGNEVDPSQFLLTFTVYMSAECSGVKNPFLFGELKENVNDWTPKPFSDFDDEVIEGWVFGFSDEKIQPNAVDIMTYRGVESFELALIEPLSDWCLDLNDDKTLVADQMSMDAKHAALPIGMALKLVGNWKKAVVIDSERMFHEIDASGSFTRGIPPVRSVNEQLVRTGFWVPDSWNFDEKPDYVVAAMQRWVPDGLFVSKLGKKYMARIAKAANQTRAKPAGIQRKCIRGNSKIFEDFWGTKDARGDSSSSGDSGYSRGSGQAHYGCTYVNGYFRNGYYVNGYFRCG